MSNINPTSTELSLLRDLFYESLTQKGFLVNIFRVLTRVKDVSQDPEVTYMDPIDVYAIFQEYPDRNVVQSLGWMTDSPNLPSIIYLPYYFIDEDGVKIPFKPVEDTKIRIPFTHTDTQESRDFVVSDLSGSAPEVIYWVARLVPARSKTVVTPPPPEETGDDYTYLNVPEDDDVSAMV